MTTATRYLACTLLSLALAACQPATTMPGQSPRLPNQTSLGAPNGATIRITLGLPGRLTTQAPPKTTDDVRHYIATLHQSGTDSPIGSAIDLYPLTTGAFTGVPDGTYYVKVDALDANSVSITATGQPVASSNTVTISATGSSVAYTGNKTHLDVPLILKGGTGGDATLTVTEPTAVPGIKLYGLSLVRQEDGVIHMRQRSDTSAMTLGGLATGVYKLWGFAAGSTGQATTASPSTITVAGDVTTGGANTAVTFPSSISTEAYDETANLDSLAVAPDGTVYTLDTANHRILRKPAGGTFSVFAGNGTAGNGDNVDAIGAVLNQPKAIAVDKDGNVYVADYGNNRLALIPVQHGQHFGINMIAGKIYRIGNASSYYTYNCQTIAVDHLGNVYTNNYFDGLIMLVAVTGQYFSNNTLSANNMYEFGGYYYYDNLPRSLTVDGWGNLYVAMANSVTMMVNKAGNYFDPNPANVRQLGSSYYSPTKVTVPNLNLTDIRGIATDGAGNLYVADSSSHKVVMIDRFQGNRYTVVGTGVAPTTLTDGEGGPAFAAQIRSPNALYMTAGGSLYLSAMNPATTRYCIRKVN